MSLISRTKNMLLSPKTEWAVIAAEEPNLKDIFLGYALLLVIASAAAAFIGHTFIWRGDGIELPSMGRPPAGIDLPVVTINETAALGWGMYYGFQTLVVGVLGVWLAAAIVNALAANFGAEKNMGRSMQLIAYAMTPVWIGGLLMIYPPIGFIGLLFGLYGLYLLYLGLPQLMKTPQEKIVPYSVFSIVISLVIFIALGFLYRLLLWDMIIYMLNNIQINAHPLK
jgi:hypothetical protein